MQDAAIGFDCNNLAGATNVTNGAGGFPTDWSSSDNNLVELQATPGVIKGIDYTTSGFVSVCAEYKEITGCTQVQVVLTCWQCNPDASCSPLPVAAATCPDPYYTDKSTCLRLCGLKWGDWREVLP